MKLKKLRILNYKCFLDSGALDIHDSMTCIVGANDAGKSTLVECLTGPAGTASFKSVEHLAAGDSVVELELEVGPEDYLGLAGQSLYFSIPGGVELSQAASVASDFLNSVQRVRARFSSSITGTFPDQGPADGDNRALLMEVRAGVVRPTGAEITNVSAGGTIPSLLANSFRSRAFVFKAERRSSGEAPLVDRASSLRMHPIFLLYSTVCRRIGNRGSSSFKSISERYS